jgi:DNA polymerase-1
LTENRLDTSIVPPEGPLTAKMLFIGEAPGREENNSLRPFVGSAGILLNQLFRTVGIIRRDVLIHNVFLQQPPSNLIGYFFRDKACRQPTEEGQEHVDKLKIWLKDLLAEREATGQGPNVIVALGATAMQVLTGKKRITKWRGSVLPCEFAPGFKVYITYHPSYVNRLINEPVQALVGERKKLQQNILPIALKDLERVQYQAEFPELKRLDREFEISLSLKEIVSELRKLKGDVGVDIETLRGPDGPLLWCIGFAPSPTYAFVVPFVKNRQCIWSPNEEAVLLKTISEVFLDAECNKIFHNGSYDLSVLGRYYGLRVADGSYSDTMFCYQATYPYLRKALAVLTSIYTWEPYYKDDGKVHGGSRISDTAEFIYNARDCCVTREIWPQVRKDAHDLQTWKGYLRSMSVMPSLLRMAIRGVKIDVDSKEKLGDRFSALAFSAQDKVNELASYPVNLASPTQVSKLLYVSKNMPIQYNHKTKKPTTDKDAINRLRKKYPHDETLEAISQFRQYSKLADTYTKMEVGSDGRVRTNYSWISTFRLSSSESHFGGGGNLQNIPVRTEEGRLIRKLFIPDEGMVFLASDLAQAEARVVAWLARDPRLIEAFLSGADVHWENAKSIFRIPETVQYIPQARYRDDITKTEHSLKWYRDRGKTIVHAANYMMGPRMLQTILIREETYVDEKTCRQFIHAYRSNNIMITQWQDQTIEEVKEKRRLVTPLGRVRVFRGRMNQNLYRSAVAFTPQSTVGELLQIAIQDIHTDLDYYDPLLNVHDEVVGQCLPENIPRGIIDVRERMEIPLQIHGKELTIPCDFKTGPNWGELKEIAE